MTTSTLDFLASTVISALEKTKMAPNWIKDKTREYQELDRLQILRNLNSLDEANLEAVCNGLGVSVADMQATFRVLKKI